MPMKRIAGQPAVALEMFVFLLRILATGLNHVENLFMVEYLKTTPVVFYKKMGEERDTHSPNRYLIGILEFMETFKMPNCAHVPSVYSPVPYILYDTIGGRPTIKNEKEKKHAALMKRPADQYGLL